MDVAPWALSGYPDPDPDGMDWDGLGCVEIFDEHTLVC